MSILCKFTRGYNIFYPLVNQHFSVIRYSPTFFWDYHLIILDPSQGNPLLSQPVYFRTLRGSNSAHLWWFHLPKNRCFLFILVHCHVVDDRIRGQWWNLAWGPLRPKKFRWRTAFAQDGNGAEKIRKRVYNWKSCEKRQYNIVFVL